MSVPPIIQYPLDLTGTSPTNAILDEQDGLKAKDAAEIAFVEHYGCFECEYYSRCGLRCFLHDTVLGEKSKECSIKKMFAAILE